VERSDDGNLGRWSSSGPWTIDPDVVAERIGGEIVLVHLRTNKIYELNASASRIFQLMRAGAGRSELEQALLTEYAVEPDRLAASFERLLGELSQAGIVQWNRP